MDLVSPSAGLGVRRQCSLLGVSRSGYCYKPSPESPENLRLMRRLDELHWKHPVYGRPRLAGCCGGKRMVRKRIVSGGCPG